MTENLFSLFYLKGKEEHLCFSHAIEAFIQYGSFRLDLMTGKRWEISVDEFQKELENIECHQEYPDPIVIHLFYEYGYPSNKLDYDDNSPLAIYIHYSRHSKIALEFEESGEVELEALSKLSFEKYHQQFNKTYEKLLDGETYQLNLTTPFYLRSLKKLRPLDFVTKLWREPEKVGAYAHATYIDSLGKLFLSNSPECLFQIVHSKRRRLIQTMPIKGTEKQVSSIQQAWKKLVNSEKNQAELYMITDLMRNDLTKLTKKPSFVRSKKKALVVPGLVHQYSVIESELPAEKNLNEIVQALFPGGSITGAPKRSTMRLIQKIENYKRGFYCGSTIMIFQNKKTASINIRSAEMDYTQNEIKYGAGGGITLQSQALEEYEETLEKLRSFLLLLK